MVLAVSVETPGTLALVDRPVDAPQAGDVTVRVTRAGICGSDIHILHGSNPFAVYPRVIGHEAAGVVEAVGDGVDKLSVGDQVVLDPVVSCGTCYACRVGRPNVCANLQVFGVHRDGGYRERFTLPAANAIKISSVVPPAIAALAEPFSVAANVLLRTGCDATDTVLIYGAGTVGLTVLQVAKHHGARCIVSDPDDSRLERARLLGADLTLNPQSDNVVEAMQHENAGLGPSLVIDGAGVPALLEDACRVASPAGRIGILGFSPTPAPLTQRYIVQKELSLLGSRLHRRLLPQVIEWLESGRLQPAAMVTHTFAMREAQDAFDYIAADPSRTIKVQLEVS